MRADELLSLLVLGALALVIARALVHNVVSAGRGPARRHPTQDAEWARHVDEALAVARSGGAR